MQRLCFITDEICKKVMHDAAKFMLKCRAQNLNTEIYLVPFCEQELNCKCS